MGTRTIKDITADQQILVEGDALVDDHRCAGHEAVDMLPYRFGIQGHQDLDGVSDGSQGPGADAYGEEIVASADARLSDGDAVGVEPARVNALAKPAPLDSRPCPASPPMRKLISLSGMNASP